MSFINCLYLIFVYRPIKAVINRGQSHFDLPGGNCKSNENLWTQGLDASVCTIFRMAESCLAEDVVRKSPRTLIPTGQLSAQIQTTLCVSCNKGIENPFYSLNLDECASPAKIRQIKTLSLNQMSQPVPIFLTARVWTFLLSLRYFLSKFEPTSSPCCAPAAGWKAISCKSPLPSISF
jgi:hypothetical protein